MPYYIGLDLGGTSIKAGVVDQRGQILAQQSAATHGAQGPEPVIQTMAGLARAVASQAKLDIDQIQAVGIGSPGPIDFDRGVLVSAPNLPAFKQVPIRGRIAQATGRPTVLENDANAAALAVYWVGVGKDPAVRDLVVLTLGTGVGGGVIVDGRVVHGGFHLAGEVGHMIVDPNGRRCGCGQRGCLETYASASHMVGRAMDAIHAGQPSTLNASTTSGRSITAKDIFQAAKAGDSLASQIVDQAAQYLGIACVNLCRLLDPQMVVLAGGMVLAGDYLTDRVRSAFEAHDWAMAGRRVRIMPAQLGSDAGLIGAAAVAWDAHHTGKFT